MEDLRTIEAASTPQTVGEDLTRVMEDSTRIGEIVLTVPDQIKLKELIEFLVNLSDSLEQTHKVDVNALHVSMLGNGNREAFNVVITNQDRTLVFAGIPITPDPSA